MGGCLGEWVQWSGWLEAGGWGGATKDRVGVMVAQPRPSIPASCPAGVFSSCASTLPLKDTTQRPARAAHQPLLPV